MTQDFVRSCETDRFGNVRRNLLALVTRVLGHDGAVRWQRELRRPGDLPQVAPSVGGISLDNRAELLNRVIQYGRKSGNSEIDAFVFASRQAHHPLATPFLLDVIQNPIRSGPFGESPAGKWRENEGGSWRDARFHAAVGLAELGNEEGILWLIKHAVPNEFGIDGSVYRHPHYQVQNGSLRANCYAALTDLSGASESSSQKDWPAWWRETADRFSPKPVRLKP